MPLSTPGYPGPGSSPSPGMALGINDKAPYSIVGVNYRYREPTVPVIWTADGSGGWNLGRVLALGTYSGGNARDVNNDGLIVGKMTSATDTVAAMWSPPEWYPVNLEMDDGWFSAALGLNNQGDVVGWTWNASGEQQAVLWTEGKSCDLNPAGFKMVRISL